MPMAHRSQSVQANGYPPSLSSFRARLLACTRAAVVPRYDVLFTHIDTPEESLFEDEWIVLE